MQSFNLDRFKAGEPSFNPQGVEKYYVGRLPDGLIVLTWKVVINGKWLVDYYTLAEMKRLFKMKPKEE